MADCLHRCVATFTCQLLVEVVSSLMTHSADSDGSAFLLPLPDYFCILYPLSQASLNELQLSTKMSTAWRHKLLPEMQPTVMQIFISATESCSVAHILHR